MSSQPESSVRVSRPSLWFGVLAPPLAWSAQELFSYMIASSLCRLRAEGFAADQVHALSTPFVLVTASTLALALAGAWAAVGNWRKAREERRDSSLDLGEIGAERTRFLARCGVINAAVFLTAFFFTTAELLVAPLCGK
jgi:hypothetical protein